MSRACQVTGAEPGFGHQISRPYVRTKRPLDANVQKERYWLPSESRFVRLTVSARGIRTIDRIGVEAAVERAWACGVKP